jgi:hypothetical protein
MLRPSGIQVTQKPVHRNFYRSSFLEKAMGKYVLGWLLGVPVVVLAVIYLLMH